MKNRLALLLAFVGAADCVVVPVLFGAGIQQQPFFPLPGLYFLEIALLGLVGLVSARQNPAGWGQSVPWGIAGVLRAFNVLGAWTIGLYLIPGTLAFLGVGWLLTEGRQKVWRGLGVFLLAALAQGILMLVLVNFL